MLVSLRARTTLRGRAVALRRRGYSEDNGRDDNKDRKVTSFHGLKIRT